MAFIDGCVVVAYLASTVAAGLWLRKRAATDITSYFVGGRNMPGWLIGTSMVATTFAADTPLAVTGLVAAHGIAGNWFWWSSACGHLAAAFIFARWWRRAEVVTDAEFTELRYAGRPAATLRALRAFFFAVPINCIIMAWVIRAMGKIVTVLFPWDQWLPSAFYGRLLAAWPHTIAIKSPSEAISILIGTGIATSYAMLGGLPSVVITDVVQFTLAMLGSLMLAIYAVRAVGGIDGLHQRLNQIYGHDGAASITAYLPNSDSAWLPAGVFLTYILVQWWAQKFSDGGGILVQRMSAARDERHALRGTTWFAIAHYALRPWPWILVGLVAMVLFPTTLAPGPNVDVDAATATVLADREMAYPILMARLLPAGALGIMVAGMAAAFMSTIDTHINWGSSYLVRDLYQRFLRPHATDARLVRAGQIGSVVILGCALAITTQIESITDAWKWFTALGAGLGLVTMLRWLWWRINAFSEMAGMLSAPVVAWLVTAKIGDAAQPTPYHVTLLSVVAGSTIAMLLATLLTPAVPTAHLVRFVEKIGPMGFWGPIRRHCNRAVMPQDEPWWRTVTAWTLATAAVFALLFGLGEAILGNGWLGWGTVAVGAGGIALALRLVDAFGAAPASGSTSQKPPTAAPLGRVPPASLGKPDRRAVARQQTAG